MPYIEAVTRWASWFLMALAVAQSLNAETRADTAQMASHLRKVRRSLMLTGSEYGPLQAEYLKWIDARVKAGVGISAMNEELKAAGLFYTWGDYGDEILKSHAGYVEEISAKNIAEDLLVLITPIYGGYGCSLNDTVVLYDRRSLHRVAAINASPPAKDRYWYRVSGIDVGGKNEGGARVVATGWIVANCTSNWNGTAIRVDRVSETSAHNILREELAAQNDEGIAPVVQGDAVSFRYRRGILDMNFFSVPALRRYRITNDRAELLGPPALTRVGFIREWLDGKDGDVARWSETDARLGRKAAISALKDNAFEWVHAAHCGGAPELWEIAVKPEGKSIIVFRVSGTHASELRMAGVADHWTESCGVSDLSAIGAELPW